jgi:hypothetical protein
MSMDDRILSDREALARRTAQALPSHHDTARALDEALAHRTHGETPMRNARRPLLVAVGAFAAAAAVLVCPIPYSHVAGWDVTFRSADGHVAKVYMKGANAEASARRASTLAKQPGAIVTIAPRTERVWGSVYAMAKESLLHIDVNMEGKTDTAVEDEIRAQLAAQGWTPLEVQVQRGDGVSSVQVGATDGDGRTVQMNQQVVGGPAPHVSMGVEDIDTKREPGMTDDQLREKIVRQFKAKGMDAEVTIEGDKVRIRVEQRHDQQH